MCKNSSKKKILAASVGFVLLYCLQFLLLPYCFPRYYPVSLEAGWSFLLLPALFCLAGTLFGKVSLKDWLIPDALYGVLMWLYNGQGLYGIGLRGVNLDDTNPIYSRELAGIITLILLAVLVAYQTLLWGLRWLFLKLKK